ncbi:MAG: hypothetical protein ACTHK3_00975 [Solirubrobacterales bacterium]
MKVVAGIPTKNEVGHIGRAVRTLDRGLAAMQTASALIVNADGSSVDGTAVEFSNVPTDCPKVSVEVCDSEGKGRNVLEILRVAREEDADVVCLFDADVTSLTHLWPAALMEPVLGSERAAMSIPAYRRSKFEANGTNHIARPLLYMLTNADVRQPIGGEFGLNRKMIEHILTRPAVGNVVRYGIDIHLTITCLQVGGELSEVPLGTKAHNPGFPKILKIGFELIDTMLRSLLGRLAPDDYLIHPAVLDERASPGQRPSPQNVAAATTLVADYLSTNLDDIGKLIPSTRTALERWTGSSEGLPQIDFDLWVGVLVDVTTQVTNSSLFRTCEAFVALYFARVMEYWREIRDCGANEVDDLLARQCRAACHALADAGGPVAVEPSAPSQSSQWDLLLDAGPLHGQGMAECV